MIRKMFHSRLMLLALVFAFILGCAAIDDVHNGDAAPSHGASVAQSGDTLPGQTVKRVGYVAPGLHTPVSGTTPVSSGAQCSQFGDLHKIEVRLVGTMQGTAPQVILQPRSSIDGGANWNVQGTAVTINATTTPGLTTYTFADQGGQSVYNATVAAVVTVPPIAYGDCWDVLETWSGTNPKANFSVQGIDK